MFYEFVVADVKLRMGVAVVPAVINDISGTAGSFVAGSVNYEMLQEKIKHSKWDEDTDMLASALSLEDALQLHGGRQGDQIRGYVAEKNLEGGEEMLKVLREMVVTKISKLADGPEKNFNENLVKFYYFESRWLQVTINGHLTEEEIVAAPEPAVVAEPEPQISKGELRPSEEIVGDAKPAIIVEPEQAEIVIAEPDPAVECNTRYRVDHLNSTINEQIARGNWEEAKRLLVSRTSLETALFVTRGRVRADVGKFIQNFEQEEA